MILPISAITDQDVLATITEQIAALTWQDGRATAGATAKAVKDNSQAVMSDQAGQKLRQILLPHVTQNAVLLSAARPRRFSHFLVSKTENGGQYGQHVDNAMMGAGEARMRSDLSFTLFLSPRDSYDGGELVIHEAGMRQEIAGEMGQLVLYPSTSIHEVRPVTSGVRHVCVGWIESLIADGAQREILFDLDNTRASLRASGDVDPAVSLTLDKSIANLIRMWAHP
ncbi:MAG: Fe2+-dependent dioxygenase [Pseudomonadota bacterium]